MASSSATARRQWEAENKVQTTTDGNYAVDDAKQQRLFKEKPWRKDPKYFTSVHLSALAMIKILMHAKTGQGKAGIISQDKSNWIEVMGVMQGHVRENTFVITDSFALPVAANEVECAMTDAASVYMIEHCRVSEDVLKRPDHSVVGWYHSHPGYSCYLSGTDVPTQTNCQTHMDPYLAIVVDPVRTISTGRVEIKAFRTYPEGFTAPEVALDADEVPQNKIEEFGAHFSRYYEVPITVYRSTADAAALDLLWNKYWMQTLSASPLSTNRHFIDGRLNQLVAKVGRAEQAAHSSGGGRKRREDTEQNPVAQLSRAVGATSQETTQGLLGMVIKQQVFSQ